MAFTVSDIHSFTRILASRPEWRAEVRRAVLTDDLLALPAIVRDLGQAQRELTAAQARTEKRLEELVAAQTRTEKRLEELAAAEARTDARLAELAAAQARTEACVAELAQAHKRSEALLATLSRRQDETLGDILEGRFGWPSRFRRSLTRAT
jgi:chromosome segregation ATPase